MDTATVTSGQDAQVQSLQTTPLNTAKDIENNSNSNNSNSLMIKGEAPLPYDLKRILKEVARTGSCSWLSWNHDTRDQRNSAGDKAKSMMYSKSTTPTSTRQNLSNLQWMAPSMFSASVAHAPPRKKRRNNIQKSNRRKYINNECSWKAGNNRKRPLLLVRTHLNTASTSSALSAPGSAGSGRTSGSEPDDSTQYECDSEGTSTTTNSEVSVERLRKTQQRLPIGTLAVTNRKLGKVSVGEEQTTVPSHKTLQEAFHSAVGIVLDHFYRNRGGYKLSPAEKHKNEILFSDNADKLPAFSSETQHMSPDDVFHLRRQRLLDMLRPNSLVDNDMSKQNCFVDGPPFTIQRIAEVLVNPERYYTQTHKLCNCLEKLLLVTSSVGAFGGSTGGDTSQTRREEREMVALADEKGRQVSELRQRRMRRRAVSPFDDAPFDGNTDSLQKSNGHHSRDDITLVASNEAMHKASERDTYSAQEHALQNSTDVARESLEAAARASLRTKFDHGGTDSHSLHGRDILSIVENRGMTNSPPPPSLVLSAAPSNISHPNHKDVSGFTRQQVSGQNIDHHSVPCVRSPILFPSTNEAVVRVSATQHPTTNVQMLHLHHAVALAGVSLGKQATPSLDLLAIDDESGLQARQQEGGDTEAEHSRSSASNSDVDSESDDISLDDSASDRSDGSDSGSAAHYEPFTAARAMALNRMQQQQRLQSRVLTSLNSLHQNEGFRPPADSEYQSGDSIDSMRAEDSGGSDSSSQSSDIAD